MTRDDIQFLVGDVRHVLPTLPAESVHCCITSPPYWGLRDYGVEGQIGLETTPDGHVEALVEVFREVWRVLRSDGTLWLNYGDAYAAGKRGRDDEGAADIQRRFARYGTGRPKALAKGADGVPRKAPAGYKPKDLIGLPWMVAFALRADGWYLRSDIVWSKANPMPESVEDRPTRSHEYLFLLTKSPRYFYDADAIREPMAAMKGNARTFRGGGAYTASQSFENGNRVERQSHGNLPNETGVRNKRSVWTIPSQPFPDSHFATFPEELVEPCILAGTSEWGCCAGCGAPWKRQTEKRDTGQRQKMADGWDTGEGGHGTIHRNGRQKGEDGIPVMQSVTVGWQPSCSCDADVVPCVCLDPFAGSGTVGKVATKLGRKSILIDLNPDYIKIAERRNAQLGMLI